MTSLTLSRQLDESIVLFWGEEQVVITVEKLTSKEVRLNFEAPKEVEIWRDELLEDEE